MTTYHAEVARLLDSQGVSILYGLVGDANLFMVDHWVQHLGGRYVAAVHEASAVMMAAGHARATGEVGVATVTHGPGLTNTITALVECAKSSIPVVLVAGRTTDTRADAPQQIDQRPLVESTGAAFVRAGEVEAVQTDVVTAFARARAEQRPVVLELPVDLAWAPVPPGTTDVGDGGQIGRAPVPVRPDPAAVDVALGVMLSARRPVVLAGRGAIGARAALLNLARLLGAPVATTALAKDLFWGEPGDLGIFGSLSTAAAQDVLADADCIVAFGTSLTQETTTRGDLLTGKALVHVDVDPAVIGGRVAPTAGVVADGGLAAAEFVRLLTEVAAPASGFVDRARRRLAQPLMVGPGRRRSGTVDLIEVLHRLDEALPRERAAVVDVGRFALHALRHFSGDGVRASMWAGAGFAAIGLGTPMAIGAAIARPERPTVLLVGDGGFALGGLNEFSTAVAHGTDLVCVVANDGSYGAEHIQFTGRGMDPGLSLLSQPDFAALAVAMGGSGVRIESEADLASVEEVLARRSGPLLLDVQLDPDRVTSLT